eukprot:TRINITY_DN6302_c0_g1_i6.p2 TRINITY_DN6302_c0_g1~~TRINITY_DN6302_c0_g1_i6.p2  ORF type:complete len:317 (-),score=41.50 TRINITY_DN6302_c0_g1_i6:1484-2434(-)
MRRVASDTSISSLSSQQTKSGGRVRRLSAGYPSSRVFKDGLNNNMKLKDQPQQSLSALPVMLGDVVTQQLPNQMVAMLEDVSKEQEVEATLHVPGMQAVHCLEQYGMKLEDLMAPPLHDQLLTNPQSSVKRSSSEQSENAHNVSLCLMTPSTDGVDNEEQVGQILRQVSSTRSVRGGVDFRERNEGLDELESKAELLYDNRKQYQNRRRRKFWKMTPNVEFPSYVDKLHTLSGVDLMLMEMNYCHGIHENCTLDKNTLTIDEDKSGNLCYLYDSRGLFCLLLPNSFSEDENFMFRVSNLKKDLKHLFLQFQSLAVL